MITIFTIPKPFQGHIGLIQRNAIRSWIALRPACEVILLGDEEGVGQMASEFNLCHSPDIPCNEYGTPLLNAAFETAEQLASYPLLCYVNADIILLSDFMATAAQLQMPKLLMVGRRRNIDIEYSIDFDLPGWEDLILQDVQRRGEMQPPWGSDYFVYAQDTPWKMPPFAVGRPAWDNWFIYRARFLQIPVMDSTNSIIAIHQNHDYSHVPNAGDRTAWDGPETRYNRQLAGGAKYHSRLLCFGR